MKIVWGPPFKNIIWVFILAYMIVFISSTTKSNVHHPKRIECRLKMSSYNGAITNEIEKLHSINLSITHIARILTTSLSKDDPDSELIQTKVAPLLFEALTTETTADSLQPVLVSFIGINGIFFSYFTRGDGEIFAVYSNVTLSSSTYTWYMQAVSLSEAGILVGEAEMDDPSATAINAEFFLEAMNMTSGYTSIGRRWCGGSEAETLVIRTVFFEQLNGAVSLGFPIEDLADLLSDRMLYAGWFKGGDGANMMLTPIPKKSVVSGDDNGDFVGERTVRFEDAKYVPVANAEVDSASFLKEFWNSFNSNLEVNVSAYTYHPLLDTIKKHREGILVLSTAIVVAFAVSGFSSAYFAAKFERKEMKLNAELRKHMEAAKQAERKLMNKSTAVATASHDVRASLSCIAGLIDICSHKVVPGSELETNLRQMDTCARDLLDLLNSILDASKIEAGKMQLEETEFDLSKLLEDVVDLYHPVGMEKGVDVVLDPCDGSLNRYPIVKGDRLKLKQVICNLLSNAVKFTTEGHVSFRAWARRPILDSTVTDSARNPSSSPCSSFFSWKSKKTVDPDSEEPKNVIKQNPNCVEYVFEVDDTGKGIPKDKWKTVFENYVQVKEIASVGGTGLGLGIVQSLVRLMGGNIEIVDKPYDQRGTCFKFNIFLTNCANDINVSTSRNRTNQGESNANSPFIDDYTNPMDAQSNYPVLARSANLNTPKASLVVLLIQNEGRQKMIRTFLESLGIMVLVAKKAQVLPSILEPYLLEPNDNVSVHTLQSPISFVLLIIDASAGESSELKDCVARSKKEISMKSYCKVIWLETRVCRNSSSQKSGEGKEIVPLVDYVTSKPLHGSRLFEVIQLLPEFCGPLMLHSLMDVEFANMFDLRDKPKSCMHLTCQDAIDEIKKSSLASRSSEVDNSVHKNSSATKEVHISPPKTSEEQKALPIGSLSSSSTPLFGKRVLIAEDNKLLMFVATKIIAKMGAFVEMCYNGQEAVNLVHKGLVDQLISGSHMPPFDFILMDCKMPSVDGFEATRMIRKEETKYSLRIPIIALTAHASEEELGRMSEVGMDYHLQKPLEESKLIEAIKFIDRKVNE